MRRFAHPGYGITCDVPDFGRFTGEADSRPLFGYSLIQGAKPAASLIVFITPARSVEDLIRRTRSEFTGTDGDQIHSESRIRVSGRDAVLYDLDSRSGDTLLRSVALDVTGADYNVHFSAIAERESFSKYQATLRGAIESAAMGDRFDDAGLKQPYYHDGRYRFRVVCPDFRISDPANDYFLAMFSSPPGQLATVVLDLKHAAAPGKGSVERKLSEGGWDLLDAKTTAVAMHFRAVLRDRNLTLLDAYFPRKEWTLHARAVAPWSEVEGHPLDAAIRTCLESVQFNPTAK
ncbi:MAG: hypothetical protein ACYC35_29565 [Pirellulales bacterium]